MLGRQVNRALANGGPLETPLQRAVVKCQRRISWFGHVPVDQEFIAAVKANQVGYKSTLGLDESAYLFAEHPEIGFAAVSCRMRCSRPIASSRYGVTASNLHDESKSHIVLHHLNQAAETAR
jgi:hypothetical protein